MVETLVVLMMFWEFVNQDDVKLLISKRPVCVIIRQQRGRIVRYTILKNWRIIVVLN